MKLIQTAFILALVSSSFASLAIADLSCPQYMPRPFSSIETQIDLGEGQIIVGKNIDCAKIGVGAKVVTGIQDMLGSELPTPSSIKFRMVDVYDNAFFNPEDLSLNVPYQIALGNYTKNPVFSIPVWAHEFGHSVLDATLREAAPKWRALIQRGIIEDTSLNPADVLSDLIQGYHEFFADCIAVLYTGRGDAVAKGLYLTGFMTNPEGSPTECPNASSPKCRPRNSTSDPRALASDRDFTDRSNQLGHWKGTNPENAHNLLAPARYHIWKYYFSNPLVMHAKGKLAGATVDALMADLNRRLARLMNQPGGINAENLRLEKADVQRINAEFINTIDATFKKAFNI